MVLVLAVCRYSAPEEVMEFPSHCSACTAPCTTRMFNIHIPFFKVSQLYQLPLADESLRLTLILQNKLQRTATRCTGSLAVSDTEVPMFWFPGGDHHGRLL